MRFEIDTQKILERVDRKLAYLVANTENREKQRIELQQDGIIAYYGKKFYDYLALPAEGRALMVHDLSWSIKRDIREKKVTMDEWLEEKRILQIMCHYLEPINPNGKRFYNEILPHVDSRGYVQLYRGICKEELAEFHAGNYGALGIWWTTDIQTALLFAAGWRTRIIGGAVLSWRVNVGFLRCSFFQSHPGEVLISPAEVLDSGQCGKIKVLNRLQIALLRRVNKSQ